MARLYVFADEAGDFEFIRKPSVSRYFVLCTISSDSCEVGDALIDLRRQLAWEDFELGEYFHASEDKQAVRNRVFETICQYPFTVQATIMEKSKAFPNTRETKADFYRLGWTFHFRHTTNKMMDQRDEALVVAASIGNRREKTVFADAVRSVARRFVRDDKKCVVNFCPCAVDPCLQVADYCGCAIQKRWETSGRETRSYDLIKDRITYEFDLYERGAEHFY
jgi:hypothetical protein